MVIASELHQGTVVRIEGQIYKVLELESKAGAAKMGGVVKTKMINVRSGRGWEPHFRPQERLEDLPIERGRWNSSTPTATAAHSCVLTPSIRSRYQPR